MSSLLTTLNNNYHCWRQTFIPHEIVSATAFGSSRLVKTGRPTIRAIWNSTSLELLSTSMPTLISFNELHSSPGRGLKRKLFYTRLRKKRAMRGRSSLARLQIRYAIRSRHLCQPFRLAPIIYHEHYYEYQ